MEEAEDSVENRAARVAYLEKLAAEHKPLFSTK
jgi:hypothetical protein